ncbi:hypothetical protein [Nocardioides sp.]|uniref:hypothetical protein n=1 Tax=Nocardioides sp. TaxID=35761 RepID=UPI00261A5354|nr:hypothetical protein [Nocardioides sp.]MDI6911479.1 hypothetical protein [Nocardioides sp.]
MTFRLVTADDVCTGAETVLVAALPVLIEALGLDEPADTKPFVMPTTWSQVPTLEALQSARFPAAAVTTTGTVGDTRESSTGVDAEWLVRVGMFDRGADYNDTAHRIRTWAALIRAGLLRHRTLGGIASGLRLAGESYRNLPQTSAARTLGGCTVDVRVKVRNIADLADLTAPVVKSTDSALTVN